MTLARPRPVTMPRRAHINWMAAISGNDTRAVHRVAYPYEAPATEYVEMPDGSSSAAPVISPGPKSFKNSDSPAPRLEVEDGICNSSVGFGCKSHSLSRLR